jgi:hypothetical protein
MTAQYKSQCPGCSYWITPGKTITLIEGEWVCNDCAEDADGFL